MADPDQPLRAWLRQYAKDPRRGYRRAYHAAHGEGWQINHKKFQLLWRNEGLRVPQRRRRKRVGTSTINAPTSVAPNVVWTVDFQFDVCESGTALKICSIIDEHTRGCICGLVGHSNTADRFIDRLEALIAQRGVPAVYSGLESSFKR